jgi:hypothetical protein
MRKGQRLAGEKRRRHFRKTAAETAAKTWYISGHEKTLLGFVLTAQAEEGSCKIAWEGKKAQTNFRVPDFTKIPGR